MSTVFAYCSDYCRLRYTSVFKIKLNFELHLPVRKLLILNMRLVELLRWMFVAEQCVFAV